MAVTGGSEERRYSAASNLTRSPNAFAIRVIVAKLGFPSSDSAL